MNFYGIYRIRAVTPDGEPIPINRLAGVDPLGTLYIGRSGLDANRTVANRIGEFIKRQHSGGITYAKAKKVLKKAQLFSGHVLQVSAKRLTKKKIESSESRELLRYFSCYGELPPCNSVMSKAGEDS